MSVNNNSNNSTFSNCVYAKDDKFIPVNSSNAHSFSILTQQPGVRSNWNVIGTAQVGSKDLEALFGSKLQNLCHAVDCIASSRPLRMADLM